MSLQTPRARKASHRGLEVTMKLNQRAYDHSKRLVDEGKFVLDGRDAWSEHQPSTQEECRLGGLTTLREAVGERELLDVTAQLPDDFTALIRG